MKVKYGFKAYVHKVAIAFDQLANTLLAGMPNETLSSRAYRSAQLAANKKLRWKIAEKLINILFIWQIKNHCYESYLSEIERNRSYATEYKNS